MTAETIEATGVELEPASDRTLFRADDPVEVLAAATRAADALKAKIEASGMVQRIGGRNHVRVEGWQTLGAMLGVTASVVWSRPLEDGWEARAEARTLDGRLVGAGEAMCTRAERNWARRDPFALRSMAQTRAMSKALKGPLGFVMTLAGHETTPAEEADSSVAAPELPSWAEPVDDATPAATALLTILEAAGVSDRRERWLAIGKRVRDRCGGQVPAIVAELLLDIAAAVDADRP